jgi:hypothetical protein
VEKSGVIYIYKETFKETTSPFSKTKLKPEISQLLHEAFVNAGGLSLQDLEISPTECWRISFWKESDGYQNWLSNEKISSYFAIREKYNSTNNISTRLEGPFLAREVVHV